MFSATRRAAPLNPARCERDLALTVENVCSLLARGNMWREHPAPKWV